MKLSFSSTLYIFIIYISFINISFGSENWSRFGGEYGDFRYFKKQLPRKWNINSVAWKVKLFGNGQSSPIIFKDQIFLTTSLKTDEVERWLLCFNKQNGQLMWKKLVVKGEGEKLHDMNSWASSTCVTDGEYIVSFFGKAGIFCFDMFGNILWNRNLGTFKGPWGVAASPIMFNDLVIQNCDADDNAYLIALNKATGQEVWKVDRPNYRGFNTPIIIDGKAGKELILNGHTGIHSYNPYTGKLLWYCKGDRGRGTPVPAIKNDVLYVICGRPGNMFAVKMGGKGDVSHFNILWKAARRGRDLPSPVIIDQFLFTINMEGVARCYQIKNGNLLWKEKLKGTFISSPIVGNDLIYLTNDKGITFVLKINEKLEIISTNLIASISNEKFYATPAICNGQIFIRSNKFLYCIG